MADKPKSSPGDGKPVRPTGGGAQAATGQGTQPQLQVMAQFVRDLSFESPNAPKALQTPGANPKLDLNINAQATKRSDEIFEVALHFEARGTSDDGVIYNIELVYAGLFKIENIPEQALEPFLLVNCPSILFPFVRRIAADLTREGGFPPLLLDPFDFASLYVRRQQELRAQAEAAPKN